MKSSLAKDVDRLLSAQAVEWPMLARGIAGLRESQTRAEKVAGREVLVRHIPHRIKSTTAAVDNESIARRPCFLCPQNLDPEERGVTFGQDYTIYCNPFPILDRHLTIVHKQHRPQRIAGQSAALLSLAVALPESFVIYNGPKCGASAPDHLHFQACSRAVFPIERDVHGHEGPSISGYIPRVLVLRDADLSRLSELLEQQIEALGELTGAAAEAMINIAAFHHQGVLTALLFPRGKHRPRVFDTGDLTVSPATIDLCGVVVVPIRKDFDVIRGADILQIFDEVTLQQDIFDAVVESMEHRR